MYIATPNMQITVVKADVIAQWKMVNPLLRALCVADVIARWRWNTTRVEVGRCYSQVADGMATVLFYF